MVHDFKKFPELTNSQMEIYYLDSPHKQITEDFRAEVIKVHDGDTITVRWHERDFDFPVRVAYIDAPELNAKGGHEAKYWLQERIEGEEVDIVLTPQRVEKWGRILGRINWRGIFMEEDIMRAGHATSFEQRREDQIPTIEEILKR